MIKLEDDSYAYLESADESSIIHSVNGISMGLKEKLVSTIEVSISTINDAREGTDGADRCTLVSD